MSHLVVAQRGLSPRTWGNLKTGGPILAEHGPIPTHVGEPAEDDGERGAHRAYPHARGGTSSSVLPVDDAEGLSPRTWGNPRISSPLKDPEGPIPTHVGEPGAIPQRTDRIRAYPHARGGTVRFASAVACVAGLSPRTWGNHWGHSYVGVNAGPIPTHVGEPCAA